MLRVEKNENLRNKIFDILQVMKLDKKNLQKRLLSDALSESRSTIIYDCNTFVEKIDEDIMNINEEIIKLNDDRPYFTEIQDEDIKEGKKYILVISDRVFQKMAERKKYSREIVNEEGESKLKELETNCIVYLLKKFRFIENFSKIQSFQEEIILLELKKYNTSKICFMILQNQINKFRKILSILYADHYDIDIINTLNYDDLNTIAISISKDDFLLRYLKHEKKLYKLYNLVKPDIYTLNCETGGQVLRAGLFLAFYLQIEIILKNVGKKGNFLFSEKKTDSKRIGLSYSHFTYINFLCRLTDLTISYSTFENPNEWIKFPVEKVTRVEFDSVYKEKILHLKVKGNSQRLNQLDEMVDVEGGNLGLVIQCLMQFLYISRTKITIFLAGASHSPLGPPLNEICKLITHMNKVIMNPITINMLNDVYTTLARPNTKISISNTGKTTSEINFPIIKVFEFPPIEEIKETNIYINNKKPLYIQEYSCSDLCTRTYISKVKPDIEELKKKETTYYSTFGMDPRVADQILMLSIITKLIPEQIPIYTIDNLFPDTPNLEKDDILQHQLGIVYIFRILQELGFDYVNEYLKKYLKIY